MHHFIASTLLSGVQLRSLSPPGRLSLWTVYSRIKFFYRSQSISDGSTNSSQALKRFLLLPTFPNLSGISPFFTNFFRLASLLALLLLLLVTRPIPRDGGMAEYHGAPEAGQLPRVWTRGRNETESRQRVSGAKSP